MKSWYGYAIFAALFYGLHQVFTKMAANKIGEGLGGFIKGDIILKINESPVPSATLFYENMIGLAGKEIELSILRGDVTSNRKISLNP